MLLMTCTEHRAPFCREEEEQVGSERRTELETIILARMIGLQEKVLEMEMVTS